MELLKVFVGSRSHILELENASERRQTRVRLGCRLQHLERFCDEQGGIERINRQ